MDFTFDDTAIKYYRGAMDAGARGVYHWDGCASWRSWNVLRRLDDADGAHAQAW